MPKTNKPDFKKGPHYILVKDEVESRPSCPHGPTLLFETLNNGKRYFACSASRDRKECSFYLTFEDFKRGKKLLGPTLQENQVPAVNYDNQRLKKVLTLSDDQRSFCHDCVQLLLPSEVSKHEGHAVKSSISINKIRKPSKLLIKDRSSKFKAQFYFDKQSKKVILDNLISHGLTRVICIGTTSIHEMIQIKSSSMDMDSILLDMDHRLGQFFPSSKFVHYNMFNHHFFERKGEKKLATFIEKSSKDQLAIVMDPPFGGLVEVFAESLQKINHMAGFEVPLIMAFLDVNRQKIFDALKNVKMTDYVLKYKGIKREKLIRARIFTSLPLKSFKLPEEGYKYCKMCEIYVNLNSNVKSVCNHKDKLAKITINVV